MKGLKILTLGTMIWALTWVWPEINEMLGLQMMLTAVIGLGLILGGRLALNHFQAVVVEERAGRADRSFRPPHDSHPIKPIGLA
jgi:hypothetical protein